MLVDKYLPVLRQARGRAVTKAGSRGERILGSLFPNRGTGWPGGWSQNRSEMVYHFTHWSWVAINLLCKKFASITPNMAYVSDAPIPGRTVKACQRALVNLTEPGKFGFNTDIGPGYDYDRKALSNGSALPYSYSEKWSGKGGFASLPWLGNDPQGFSDGGHSWLTMGEYRSKALSVVKPHEELEPLEHGHPLRRLIENPNPFDTQYDLRYELLMFRKLTGVSYLWMCPNDWGMPAELWVLPSHWVWPRTGGGRYVSPDFPHADELIQYYEVRPWGGMGSAGMLRIPPNEVMMTLYKSPINKIDGYSPLHAMARWQDLEESNSQARWSQMVNMARPEMAIKLGPGYEDVDDDRIARIEAKFLAKLQGEANTGKPFILPSGAELQLLSFTPEQMLYGGTEEQVRDMLLSGHNVPPAAVGLVKEMTYGSILATLSALCSFGLNPELVQEGQALTKHLASKYDENAPAYSAGFSEVSPGTFQSRGFGGRATFHKIRVWYDDCVPADPQQINNDIQADQASFAITPNEVRALRGRKPYKLGGNNPMIQGPGVMPYPMNEVEDVGDFADVIGELSQADAKNEPDAGPSGEPEGQALPGSPLGDDGKPAPNGKPLDGSPLANGKKPKKPEGRRGEDVRPPKNPPPEDTMDKPKKPKPENEVDTSSNGSPKKPGTKLTAGPPKKPNGPPKKELKEWDDWFALVDKNHGTSYSRDWEAVKRFDFTDQVKMNWAGLIELKRIKDWSPSDTMGSCVCGHDRDDHEGGVTGCNLCECPDYQVVHNGVQDVELDDEVEKWWELQASPGVAPQDAVPVRSHDRIGTASGHPEESLDHQGGKEPENKVDDEALRKADFIRLPDGVDGTNCSNCLHIDSGKCQFEGELPGGGYVDLRGLPVTERDCCVAWNADGVGRDWEKGWRHPLAVAKELDLTVDDEKALGDTVQAAGAWLADKWQQLEARYGRKTALAMTVSMAATIPIPGSIPAIVAAAEAIRGLQGYFQRELGGLEVVK